MKTPKARIRILPWLIMGLIFVTATGCDWLCSDTDEEEESDVSWVKNYSPVLSGTGFEMWYGGGEFGSWLIGHATSTDGIAWERDADNPVMGVSDGVTGWDITYVGWPTVLPGPGSKLRIWYSSTTYNVFVGGGIGYAEKQ